MAYYGDFGGGAVFHHIQQRDDGGGRKVAVVEVIAVSVEFFAERQFHQFQVFKQRFERGAGQGGQQLILLCATEANPRRKLDFPASRWHHMRQQLVFLERSAKLGMVHIIPHRLFYIGMRWLRCWAWNFCQSYRADHDVVTLKAYVIGEHKISSRHFVVSIEAEL